MRSFIKYLALFLLLFSCRGDKESLDTGELVLEFENLWWEAPNEPTFDNIGGDLCFNFTTTMFVDDLVDGKIVYFTEQDSSYYILSDFDRTSDGYYLPGYDVSVKVLSDNDGNYSLKIKSGIVSRSLDIIPCALGL